MSVQRGPEPRLLRSYARALRHRYPGISVEVRWNNHETEPDSDGKPGYKGWMICCAGSAPLLARYGLATDLELAGRVDARPDEYGHHRGVHGAIDRSGNHGVHLHIPDQIPEGHWSERRVHSKKMQRQLAKLLSRAFSLPRRRHVVIGDK
jgi:hypothetical protein